ncbi:SulP family inorganic anion transporter [Lusitaniella coriacea LEGE 07157]|uniref:SulP family inorganic anion transporter n=1 Tax=Lusitaniella coriacea LEGE 07157 TaxID=945747 RepID=A0A8J7DZX0_9CYAN|nr:SulP family inorganic anion transporter [Lusitaniella coriacea]MBE9116846.1 SulP family inorganic anion transporter [Lusitaniella coriacea LEGE 07157]
MKKNFTQRAWFSNIPNDLLAGAVVALALIPEAIAFSIIAGVDPKVGLYASFCIAIITSFMGGRPGMISAATGAMALLMTPLVREHGINYLFATTILTGILQIVWGWVKLGNQMRFVPRAVMIGFVNALAILIFNAQLPQLEEVPVTVYVMVAAGLGIIYGLPRLTKVIPSPLVAIVVLTAIAIRTGLNIPTVGDMGTLPTTLPSFNAPIVPLNFETIEIVLPYALALSLVGLLESFLTANVIDDLTDTPSNKNQEALGQGIANIATGFFGGMAGCAMIGQSVINIRSGGRTRLSTLSAGILLLLCILLLGDWVAQIPMAALVAVMIMVSISTFSWNSIRNVRNVPKSETAVTLTTIAITLLTHNLAIGVIVGVALSAIFFSRKIAALVFVDSAIVKKETERLYTVNGQIFFVSVESFLGSFDFREHLERVTIDLTHAHLWDHSAVDAVDKVVLRFRKRGVEVDLIGLNEASATLLDRLAIHDKPDAFEQISNH